MWQHVRRTLSRWFRTQHRGRRWNWFQGYFSFTILRTPFGSIRFSRHITAWKSFFGFFFSLLSFVIYMLYRHDPQKLEDFYFFNKQFFGAKTATPVFEEVPSNVNILFQEEAEELATATRSGTARRKVGAPSSKKRDYVHKLEVIRAYPHAETSFTQGLFVDENISGTSPAPGASPASPTDRPADDDLVFVESLGIYGESALQKRRLSDGKLLKRIDMGSTTATTSADDAIDEVDTATAAAASSFFEYKQAQHEFGEGATFFRNFYWQLVWQKAEIHQYDENFRRIATFELKNFDYKDGWGLTNDENFLYATDSGDRLYKLELEYETRTSSSTEVEKDHAAAGLQTDIGRPRRITGVRTVTGMKIKAKHNKIVQMANELEFISAPLFRSGATSDDAGGTSYFSSRQKSQPTTPGELWANIYGKDCIARLNPETGKVKGFVLGYDLRMDHELGQKAEVFNGIAYDKKSGRLFVTGKLWNTLFEVKVVSLPQDKLPWDLVKQLCVPVRNVFHS
ncbi:unnamed protein product [Amoebophrya sp. A120]|nr:unnamed protein product [Amoebophrya sp. A120]|eukprot:GSA120T00018736001.1